MKLHFLQGTLVATTKNWQTWRRKQRSFEIQQKIKCQCEKAVNKWEKPNSAVRIEIFYILFSQLYVYFAFDDFYD